MKVQENDISVLPLKNTDSRFAKAPLSPLKSKLLRAVSDEPERLIRVTSDGKSKSEIDLYKTFIFEERKEIL